MSESRPAPAVRNYLIDGLVLAGAGVALLSWFGRFHWTFDLLSHFRLQEAVVVWLLAVLAWVSERRFVAVLATGVFLLQANSLRAIWSHPLVIPMGQPRLKCVYANLHSDNVDFAAILEWIDQEQPDVIALLEYSAAWDEAMQPKLAAWPYRALLPREDHFGIALYSRRPLGQTDWFVPTPETPPTLVANFAWEGRDVSWVLTHPYPPVRAWAANMRDQELAAVAELPALDSPHAVLLGDLNATPWSRGYRLLSRAKLRDARLGHGLLSTWNAAWPRALRIPIDTLMVGPKWIVASIEVGPQIGSDHLPLVFELCPLPQ